MEALAQEALHLAGAADGPLVLFAQLVHAHDGNDVLQLLVALQHLLDGTGDLVVLLTHDLRAEDAAGGVQRVHSGVDALRCDVTAQNCGGIQVGKGGGRGRVRQVVGRHINGLHRGDGTLPGGGDALLQSTHLRSQGRLVAHSRGHTAQQCGHLRACLGKTEDVVDEQ